MKSVSLVLGSGGARGLSHIGIIHWLEEHDHHIQSISGCSMGALIGGIYAAGKLDEFEKWVRAITKLDIIALLDISWSKSGLVKGDKIINTLIDLVGDIKIEDLPINYTAVAADVNEEKEIWINSGRLFDIPLTMHVPHDRMRLNRARSSMVEQWPFKPLVAGSIPAALTFLLDVVRWGSFTFQFVGQNGGKLYTFDSLVDLFPFIEAKFCPVNSNPYLKTKK